MNCKICNVELTQKIVDFCNQRLKGELLCFEHQKDPTKEIAPKQKIHMKGMEYGLLFNNTIQLIIEKGKVSEIDEHFDKVFDKLVALNERKKKEYDLI